MTDDQAHIRDKPQKPKKPNFREQLRLFLKERKGWSEDEIAALALGRLNWRILGTIILVSQLGPIESIKNKEDLSDAFKSVFPKTTCVVALLGRIKGELRRPDTLVLTPNGVTTTVHKENGIKFLLDVTKVMFAAGNGTERMRFAQMNAKDEVVLDMFAGIGYFSIPMAKKAGPKKVISLDKNPDSIYFLKENIKLNGVEDIVVVYEGDNRTIANEWIGLCDRVLIGYLPDAEPFIERALQFAKPEKAILHYHYIARKDEFAELPAKHFEEHLRKVGRKMEILHIENVKNYAPQLCHYTADILVTSS